MKAMTALSAFFLFASASLAQNKPSHDWMPATVSDVTYNDEEKVIPRSHMVKRQGCQGGIGCYSRVEDEPTHIPLKVANYRFETSETSDLVRMVVKYGNGREKPLNVTINGKTQIALEGMKIHVLQDDGQDVKLDIVEKIAKTPST